MKVLTLNAEKVKKKDVLDAARKNGIWSLRELARRASCSETAIHMMFERPSRYPNVRRKVRLLTGV